MAAGPDIKGGFVRREPRLLPLAPVPVVLVVIAVMALAFGWHFATTDSNASPKVAVAGGVVAIVAFIFNAWFTARQNRIKFTLDLYFGRYSNATYNERANLFYRHRDIIKAAATEAALRNSSATGAGTNGDTIADAVLYMLNYWETLATAYVEEHLDREAFNNVSRDIVVMAVERTARLIGEKRDKDAEYFENIVALFWRFADADTRAAVLPLIGPPSGRLPANEQAAWSRLIAPGVAEAAGDGGFPDRVRGSRFSRAPTAPGGR